MNKDSSELLIISVYAIFQISLSDYGLLNPDGSPKKLHKKSMTQDIVDAFSLYEWSSFKVKGIPEYKMKNKAKLIEEEVNVLVDDYYVNQYLMALFLLDNYVHNSHEGILINSLGPKLTRMIKFVKGQIVASERASKEEIIKDSSIMAGNYYRLLDDEEEITKEKRAMNVKLWKSLSTKKSKTTLLEDIV